MPITIHVIHRNLDFYTLKRDDMHSLKRDDLQPILSLKRDDFLLQVVKSI